MNKRKKQPRLFRWLAVALAAFTLTLLVRFPGKEVSLENQKAQLAVAASAYYDAQARNNQLKTELSEIESDDFIERTARREYGYCWYGETVYEVENLDAIMERMEFEVYGAN